MNGEDVDEEEQSIPPPLPSIPPLNLIVGGANGSEVQSGTPLQTGVISVPVQGTPQPAIPPTLTVQTPRAETLMIRVDQPVEGVEFQPHTLLRGVDGGIVMPSNRRLEYTWLRSKARRSCDEASCTKQREAATIQDLVTGKRYCSKHCMTLGFRAGGRLVHTTDASRRRIPKSESIIDYDETDHAVWDVKPFTEDSDWIEVGKERNYVPTSADVGHVLKLVVKAMSQDGSATTVTSTSEETPVVIGPPPALPIRRLIQTEFAQYSDSSALQFRVVTYNILADIYATQNVFPYCPKWALSWRYRKIQLLRELQQYDADIICLQEVQQDHYQQFLLPNLERMGYTGLYKSKTRDSHGNGGKVDGCAILFKRERFKMCGSYYEIEFNKVAYQMAQQGAFGASNSSGSNRSGFSNDIGVQACLKRLCRDNVAQAILLQATAPNGELRSICVANTHIFWDPDYPDVKLWQTYYLLRELERITGSSQMPLVLCGDFNSTPESSVFDLITTGDVNPKHVDLVYDKLGILSPVTSQSHPFSLVSAMTSVTGSEPPLTNYTGQFKGVLDYVWLNDLLAAVACLEIPSEDKLRGIDDTPLPNSVFPSDHVAICVDIRLASNMGQHTGSQESDFY